MSTAKRKAASDESDAFSKPLEKNTKKSVRHRTALACEECRARKRRCDGVTPACGGCVKRMSVCVYASEIQTKMWQDSMIESLWSRLKELERGRALELEPQGCAADFDAPIPDSGARIGVNDSTADAEETFRQSNAGSPAVIDATFLDRPPSGPNIMQAEIQTSNHCGARVPRGQSAKVLEPCSVERPMEPISQTINSRNDQNDGPGLATGPSNAVKFDRIGQIGCFCDHLLNASQWRLPLRRRADGLVAFYFARVHRMYPIIHERTFQRQYDALWQSTSRPMRSMSCPRFCKQRSRGKTFVAMLYAILALASLFEPGILEQNILQGDRYFDLTQEIDLLDILDYEVGIELVQLGLLMGFYLQSTERFSKCRNITGLTIQMAQNMGLHLSLDEARRKGLFAPHATQLDCEMRIRVWYGCILLDRELSALSGRALIVVTDGGPMRLPEPIDDDLLSEERGSCNAQPAGLPSLLESYIQTIKLYDILKQVLDREDLTKSQKINPDIPSLLSLDTSLMEWRDALPSHLLYDAASEETSEADRDTDTTSNSQFGFSAQAKRLYTRFLHVRTLILRPALDVLFHKQQLRHPVRDEFSIDGRAQDLVLPKLGTLCVVSSQALVKLLGAQIRSKSLVAWCYNINYLNTCGSTLLMAQLCTFEDMSTSSDISDSWDLCLQCISLYTSFSSIARKSVHLLKESAKCLLRQGSSTLEAAMLDDPSLSTMNPIRRMLNDNSWAYPQPVVYATTSHEDFGGNPGLALSRNPGEDAHSLEVQSAQTRAYAEQQRTVVHKAGPTIDASHLERAEADLRNDDTEFDSYWPFMRIIPHSEMYHVDVNSSDFGEDSLTIV